LQNTILVILPASLRATDLNSSILDSLGRVPFSKSHPRIHLPFKILVLIIPGRVRDLPALFIIGILEEDLSGQARLTGN
jgi:hypothetical protein